MSRSGRVRRLWRWLRQDVLSARAADRVEAVRTGVERLLATPLSLRLRREGVTGRRVRFEALGAVSPVAVAAQDGVPMVVSTADRVLGKATYVHGSAELQTLQRALAVLGRSHVELLVDVGAHIGTVCVPALARGLARRAIAVEPDPDNLRLLRANVHLNGLGDRVRVAEAAVGDHVGMELQLARHPDNHGDHRVGGVPGESRELVAVPSITLDALLQGEDLTDALVWMDIQGSEGAALRAAEILRAARVPVALEVWPAGLQAQGGWDPVQTLLASSARVVRLDGVDGPSEPLSAPALARLVARLRDSGRHADLLCVP